MIQDDGTWETPHSVEFDQKKAEQEQLSAYADGIAKLLDASILIPGTTIRIGLDPLLGMIPIIGDLIANAIGSMILFLAVQLHVPKIVLARMSLNILINTFLGAIPGIGDFFSFWFKSNLYNANLLRTYARANTTRSTMSDWIFVIGLLLCIILFVLGITFTIVWVLKQVWHMT
ncbi:MAG: DUF4112 domain-containing protein [Nitrospirales bacterium]|nr:DUF4112 domain-containing protein [Nitrospirales bacterium]